MAGCRIRRGNRLAASGSALSEDFQRLISRGLLCAGSSGTEVSLAPQRRSVYWTMVSHGPSRQAERWGVIMSQSIGRCRGTYSGRNDWSGPASNRVTLVRLGVVALVAAGCAYAIGKDDMKKTR